MCQNWVKNAAHEASLRGALQYTRDMREVAPACGWHCVAELEPQRQNAVNAVNSLHNGEVSDAVTSAGLVIQREARLSEESSRSVDEYAVEETVEDLEGLAALFADGEQGFAVKLDGLVEGFVTSDGLIDSRMDGSYQSALRPGDPQQLTSLQAIFRTNT